MEIYTWGNMSQKFGPGLYCNKENSPQIEKKQLHFHSESDDAVFLHKKSANLPI
jgi:hypothetical protein